MLKPPHEKLQKTVTPMANGGGSPRQPTASNSGASLSNFSFSGQRAGATTRSSTTTPRSASMPTNGEKEPWMETATPKKFDEFQLKIFPVIEYLTAKPEHANHALTKRWLTLKRTPNIPMAATITWRNLKILLGIKTMFEYCDFLTQCPEFSSAVKLQNSRTSKSGFDFGIYAQYKTLISSPMSSQERSMSKSSFEDDFYVLDINIHSPAPSIQTAANGVDVNPTNFQVTNVGIQVEHTGGVDPQDKTKFRTHRCKTT